MLDSTSCSVVRAFARGAASVGVFVLAACSSCPDELEALEEPGAKTVETGVVGVVVLCSDTYEGDCPTHCSYSKAELEIWGSETPVHSKADRDSLRAQEPDQVVAASGRYHQALDPGHYLVCAGKGYTNGGDSMCVAFELEGGRAVTIHVKLSEGNSMFAFDASGQRHRVGDFEVLSSD